MTDMNKFPINAAGRRFLPFDSKENENWSGAFVFIHSADTQFGMYEHFVEKRRDNYGWHREIAWSEQMVAEINSMVPKPKFVVICGDLLEAFPETDSKLREKQEKDFKKVFSALDIPLLCVCGNHDIGNTPTEDTIATYRSSFGDDYFSFWCEGVYFIVINSQFYEDDSKVKKLSTEHETWLEEQLEYVKSHQPKHSIILQHIPWFQHSPDEPKNPWNFPNDIRQVMLKKYYDAGIRHVYCGHYHRNGGGFYKDMELIVTAAVGVNVHDDGITPSNDHGYRIVKVMDNKLEHIYYELGTAPSNISLDL